MSYFKYGNTYSGQDIIDHLDNDCIDKNSEKEITFTKGLKLKNSKFILNDTNVIKFENLEDFEKKLDYYTVDYECTNTSDYTLIPKIQTYLSIPEMKKGSTENLYIDKNLRRCYLNCFLINISFQGQLTKFLVYEQDGVTPVPTYASAKTRKINNTSYYYVYCDLVPGNTYVLKNNTAYTMNLYYAIMKGDEW